MRQANTVIVKNFDTFAEARIFALQLGGTKRLTRIENRRWRGNGFGYEPACYAALHPNGQSWCDVVPRACYGWSCIYEVMPCGRVVAGGKDRRK